MNNKPILLNDAEPKAKKKFEIQLGTFVENEFIWHLVDTYDDLRDAYKAFKKYVNSQLQYTDEELKKVWETGRLDIELREGNKLLNWVGIYSRAAFDLLDEEKAATENVEINKKKEEKKEK